jgi:hypothetical protein
MEAPLRISTASGDTTLEDAAGAAASASKRKRTDGRACCWRTYIATARRYVEVDMEDDHDEQLLNFVIDRLAWLEDDGYLPVQRHKLRSRFRLAYSSARGRVTVSVDRGRDGIEMSLAPPDPDDPQAPIDFLRSPYLMMEAYLETHGLPSPPSRWGHIIDRPAVVASYLDALPQLRDELAGDWSLYPVAREVSRSGRDAAFEYWIGRAVIDDPALAERLERLRSIGPSH